MIQDIKPNVGVRLRAFRERQGWSLRMLAQRCGLSINAISRIERGENSPTVSSLHRLATALAVPITDFFLEKPKQAVILVKDGSGKKHNEEGFVVEHLGKGLPNQQLEPFMLIIEPECSAADIPIDHPGEEFVHCLSGEIEYHIGDEIYHLTSGDSLLFESSQPHFWRNTSSAPAKILLVFQAAQDNSLARQRHQTG
jgi:transcriptional regulator with XRE-family HTH domain